MAVPLWASAQRVGNFSLFIFFDLYEQACLTDIPPPAHKHTLQTNVEMHL